MQDGFFDLTKPEDLLKKLDFDFQRMKANPVDTYAAFDFFVAAAHMPEWVFPEDPDERRKCKQDPLFAACWHLGNGAKHFRLTSNEHKSVADAVIKGVAFQPDAFQSPGFQVGHLVVEFSTGASASLGAEISATELAELVLEYWRKTLTAHSGNHPTTPNSSTTP